MKLWSLAVLPAVFAQNQRQITVSNVVQKAWRDTLGSFLRDQTQHDMESHGCWCTKLNFDHSLFPNHGGKPVDELDAICRRWFQARRCIHMEKGPCNDLTVYGKAWRKDTYSTIMTNVIDKTVRPMLLEIAMDCDQADRCGKAVCKIDAHYANEVLVFFQKVKNVHWYDSNTEVDACKSPTAHLHPQGKQTCDGDFNDVSTIKINNSGMVRGLTAQIEASPSGDSKSVSQKDEEEAPVVDNRSVQEILEAREFKSEESTEEVTIQFTNDSGNILSYYWIDYNGDYSPYYVLMPDQSYDQPSYASHPWAIRDLVTGDFISIYQVPKDFPSGTVVKVRTNSDGEVVVSCVNCDA